MALCLRCGEMKFGAFCACPTCGVASTGNPQLDIRFSDHHFDSTSLSELGLVVKAICDATTDPEMRHWAFLSYCSTNHPSILKVSLTPDWQASTDSLLASLRLPQVTLRPSRQSLRNRAPLPEGSDGGRALLDYFKSLPATRELLKDTDIE